MSYEKHYIYKVDKQLEEVIDTTFKTAQAGSMLLAAFNKQPNYSNHKNTTRHHPTQTNALWSTTA